MPLDIKIVNQYPVKVTKSGELVTAPLKYSDSVFNAMNAINTAFNFYEPSPVEQFVITGFNIKADRNVSNTVDANVIIYEADSIDTITASRVLFEEAMIRGERTGYTNTNILCNPGKWISAKTTDATIYMTVFGYFIDKL